MIIGQIFAIAVRFTSSVISLRHVNVELPTFRGAGLAGAALAVALPTTATVAVTIIDHMCSEFPS